MGILLLIVQLLIVLERTGVISVILSEMFYGYMYMIRVIGNILQIFASAAV